MNSKLGHTEKFIIQVAIFVNYPRLYFSIMFEPVGICRQAKPPSQHKTSSFKQILKIKDSKFLIH